MPMVDLTNPLIAVFIILVECLLIIIGKQVKKSFLPVIGLILILILIIFHSISLNIGLALTDSSIKLLLQKNLILDILLILVCLLGYMWVDDIETRETKKKSVSNSLDWFWNKI